MSERLNTSSPSAVSMVTVSLSYAFKIPVNSFCLFGLVKTDLYLFAQAALKVALFLKRTAQSRELTSRM